MSQSGRSLGRKERQRACIFCNKSRTKCIWSEGEATCDRCTRLRHTCVLPDPGEKRKRGPSTRVGQLEEKIDGLMTLLNGSRQISQSPIHASLSTGPLRNGTGGGPDTIPSLPPCHSVPDTPVAPSQKPPEAQFTGNTPPIEHIEIIQGFRLTLTEAEDMFRLYKTTYSPLSPFVPIPSSTSAYDLFTAKPFLFRTIMQAVAPQSAAVQKDVAVWFREYIAEHIIIKQEKSFEILQAILVCVAWGDYHFYVAAQATNLLQLMIALVIDLDLNKAPKRPGFLPGSLVEDVSRDKGVAVRPPHTLEEMRALLGCFYLNSLAATLFRRSYHFPHTNYLSMCCNILENMQEYESDIVLVAQIRMQRSVLKALDSFPNQAYDGSQLADFHASLHMMLGTTRKELETLKRDLPADVQKSFLFPVIFSGMLMRLYEPAIYMRSSAVSNNVTDGPRRTEALWSCLEACRMFFVAYLAIPAKDAAYLPFTCSSLLSFGIVTISRLLFLNDSDWDIQLARKAFTFSEITQRLADHYWQADQFAATEEWRRKRRYVDVGRSTMLVSNDKVRWIRSWFASKLVPVEEDQQHQATTSNGGAEEPDVEMFELDMLSPGQFDPSFWSALHDEDFGGAGHV